MSTALEQVEIERRKVSRLNRENGNLKLRLQQREKTIVRLNQQISSLQSQKIALSKECNDRQLVITDLVNKYGVRLKV